MRTEWTAQSPTDLSLVYALTALWLLPIALLAATRRSLPGDLLLALLAGCGAVAGAGAAAPAPSRTLFRAAALALHAPAFLGVVVSLAVLPPTHKSDVAIRARAKRRHGLVLDALAASLQHLTVCALGVLVVYLLLALGGEDGRAGALLLVALPLQSAVGLLFWGLCFRDGWLLFPRRVFPRSDKVANAVLRRVTFAPTLKSPALLGFWALMQQQHTLAPLTLWVELLLGWLPPTPAGWSLGHELLLMAAVVAGYVSWNLLAWRVRGVAPYPIQEKVVQSGSVGSLYWAGMLLVLALTGLCHRCRTLHLV